MYDLFIGSSKLTRVNKMHYFDFLVYGKNINAFFQSENLRERITYDKEYNEISAKLTEKEFSLIYRKIKDLINNITTEKV